MGSGKTFTFGAVQSWLHPKIDMSPLKTSRLLASLHTKTIQKNGLPIRRSSGAELPNAAWAQSPAAPSATGPEVDIWEGTEEQRSPVRIPPSKSQASRQASEQGTHTPHSHIPADKYLSGLNMRVSYEILKGTFITGEIAQFVRPLFICQHTS